MPALRLPGLVLQRESIDSIALLNRVFSVGFAGSQGAVNDIERCRSRKLGCRPYVSIGFSRRAVELDHRYLDGLTVGKTHCVYKVRFPKRCTGMKVEGSSGKAE